MQIMVVTIGKDLTLVGTLPATPVGALAAYTLTPKGGTPPYRVRLLASDLPAEWTVTIGGDGVVTIDTPEAEVAGEYTVAFTVKDADRDVRTIIRQLRVIALPLEISGSLANFTVGVPYSDTLTVTGGVPPRGVIAALLPAGVGYSLLGDTLTISGTPTGAGLGPGTSFDFDVSIVVEDGASGTANFGQATTITVSPVAVTLTLPDATVGVAYTGDADATGGTGGYAFTKIAGPSWLSVNSSTGALTGTPTGGAATGVTVTVRATDSEGNTGDGTDTMDVAVPKATWSTTDKNADLVLSNGNRDVTRSSGTGWATIRSSTGKNSGKLYAEIEITALSTGTVESPIVGFCTAGYSLSDFIGNAAGGAGIQPKNGGSNNGFFFVNSLFNNLGVFTNRTCPVSVAIDFGAGKGWVGKNPTTSGAFAVSNATIEAGNTPDFTFTPGTTMFLAASVNRTGATARINTGQSAYARTPPTGFGDWIA